jgi:hypothetical protein
MPKTSIPLSPETPTDSQPAHARRALWIGVLAAGLAPFLWEGAAICHSQWCEVIGHPREVRTPILETVHEHLDSTQASIRESMENRFRTVPWNPKIVISIGGVVTALAMAMLKKETRI